jgi:hypothetical protein
MQGQQSDRVGAWIKGVCLGAERDLGEESRQVVAAPTGERREDLSCGAHVHRSRTRSF